MSPLQTTMWPLSTAAVASAGFGSQDYSSSSGRRPNNNNGLNLERCARLLPHDNDTGGFFLALFEKVAEIPGTAGRLSAACAPTALAPSDLVPLEKCATPSALRGRLEQQRGRSVSSSEGASVGGEARVWASVDDGGGKVVRAPVDMPSGWVEDGRGGTGAPGVIFAGLPLL